MLCASWLSFSRESRMLLNFLGNYGVLLYRRTATHSSETREKSLSRLMSEEEGSDDSVKDASISRSSTEGSTTSSRKSSLSTTKDGQSKVEKLLDKGEKQIISTTLKKSCNWLREGMNVFVQKELGVLRYIGECRRAVQLEPGSKLKLRLKLRLELELALFRLCTGQVYGAYCRSLDECRRDDYRSFCQMLSRSS